METFTNTRTKRVEIVAPGTMLYRALVKDADWIREGDRTGHTDPALLEPNVRAESGLRRDEIEAIARENDIDPEGQSDEDLLDAIRGAKGGEPPVDSTDDAEKKKPAKKPAPRRKAS